MFFNPLFIQPTGTEDSDNSIRQMKLNTNSYLFSDIVKLNYEKTKVGKDDGLSLGNFGDLNLGFGSNTTLGEKEILNNLVGMPTLEMLTIVEPKVLNNLVEKVFQANNTLSSTADMFSLNKQSGFSSELKSEIYGSEEKLVEFLEQLLPGMVLVDTSKQVDYKLDESSKPTETGLNVLPLPESNTVISDILNRLKLGQTVQITAKVDEEKIKLTIQKVNIADAGKNPFANTISEKLATIEDPNSQTSISNNNSSGETHFDTRMPFLTSEEKTALLTGKYEAVPTEKDLNVNSGKITAIPLEVNENSEKMTSGEQILSNEKTVSPGQKLNSGNIVVDKTNQQATELSQQLEAEQTTESDTEGNKLAGKVLEQCPEKVEGLSKFKTETISTSEEEISIKVSKPITESKIANEEKVDAKQDVENYTKGNSGKDELLIDLKTKLNTISNQPKDKEIEIAKSSIAKENEASVKVTSSEVLQTSELESAKIAIQNKFFSPIKKKESNEGKADKYKIEITQEKDETSTHKTLKASQMGVDNLLNFRKQSEKVDKDLAEPLKLNVEELQAKGQEQKTTSSEQQKADAKSEIKVEKPTIQVKGSETHEAAKTGNSENFDRVLKNAANLKEVVKTVRTSQIFQEVKSFIQGGEHKTLVLRLLPESLGKMKVTLDFTNNQVNGNIEVENESVKQMVMANIDTLKHSITQSGIQVSGFNISLAHQDQKARKEFAQKKKEESGNGTQPQVGDVTSEIRERKMGYNTYEFLA